jgi:serine/threonine-protein kinase HipA
MPEKLYVHADLGDGTILLAGQLIVDEKAGRFKYAKAYIDHPRAFALDPINLPLNADIHVKHRTRDTPAMFGVLIDAGPDEWGRRWLTKTRQPPPVTQVEFLIAASGEGVGALHFTPNLGDPVRPPPERPFENLVHLQHIAADIESGKEVDRALEPFFFHGSGIGGARPKSLIEHDGREWITKFNRDSDLVDMCRVELASMRMARDAGIEVPDVELTETDRGPVLLVERFDQSPDEQHHLVSVASLINKFDITEIDESTMSYTGGRVSPHAIQHRDRQHRRSSKKPRLHEAIVCFGLHVFPRLRYRAPNQPAGIACHRYRSFRKFPEHRQYPGRGAAHGCGR